MPDIPYKYLKESNTVFYPVVGPSSVEGQIPVSSGGTGASTALAARENLGAVSAENVTSGVQPGSFVLGIDEGGTGATTAADARINLGALGSPTFIYYETTTDGNTIEIQYPTTKYTVSGEGFLICTGYVRTDSTSDTGTAHAIIEHKISSTGVNYYRAWNMYRLQTAQALEIGTCATAAFTVANGDTVDFLLGCSKNGTKRIRYTILCFGCTLS